MQSNTSEGKSLLINIFHKIESTGNKILENDLLVFLQFYFVLAKNSIDSISSDITKAKSSLNFWQSFAQNFKDQSFIDLILSKEETERSEFIQNKIYEIMQKIEEFFKTNCSDQGKKININKYRKMPKIKK